MITKRLTQRAFESLSLHVIIVILSILFVLPILWLAISSLKFESDFMRWPIVWFPSVPNWENYTRVLTDTRFDFVRSTLNTITLALIFSVPNVISSAFAGYAFGRWKAPGRNALFVILMAMMMIPASVTVIPQFVLYSRLGLINNYMLWFLWGVAGTPFQILLFRQFFSSLPRELEDAAAIDGAGPLRTFVQIFLPNARPVLAVTFLFAVSWVWGDWFHQALFLSGDNSTLAMRLATAFTDPRGNAIVTLTLAGLVVYAAPLLLVYLVMQRQLVQGIVTTGLKG
jgi:ABC-type glycerol-3-phosphate transport system permease component